MRATKFTTFFSTEIDPAHEQRIRRYESRIVTAYGNIEKAAAAASAPKAGQTGAFAASQRRLDQAGQQAARTAERQRAANDRLTQSQTRLQRGLNATATALNVVQGPLGPLAGRVSAVSRAISELTGVALGFAAVGATLFAGAKLANEYAGIEGRLRTLFPQQERVNASMREVAKIARDARQELRGVADLYVRITSVAEDVGIAQSNAGRITELASKAAALSGGTAQTQSAGLGQFAQGIGSGVLSGDELKSVRENTFALAQAIASGLGKTIGDLKDLGAEGKLTSEVVAEALLASADQIEAKYARLPATLGQAGNVIGNSFLLFVGQADQALGVTKTLAEAILFLADNLEGLTTIVIGAGAAFGAIKLARFLQEVTAGQKGIVAVARELNNRTAAIVQSSQNFAAAARTEATAARSTVAALREKLAAHRGEAQAARQSVVANRTLVAQYAEQARIAGGLAGTSQALRNAQIDLTNSQVRLATAGKLATGVQGQLKGAMEGLTAAERRQVISAARLERVNAQLEGRLTATGRASFALRRAMGELFNMTNVLAGGFAILVTALISYANRSSRAEQATNALTDAQRRLKEQADETSQALDRQSATALKAARVEAKTAQRKVAFQGLRQQQDLANALERQVKFKGGPETREANAIAAELRKLSANNKIVAPNSKLLARINKLQAANPALSEGNFVTNAFGFGESVGEGVKNLRDITRSFDAANQGLEQIDADLKSVAAGAQEESRIRKAGGTPTSAAMIRAEAKAELSGTSATSKANAVAKDKVNKLNAEFGIGPGGKLDSARAADYKARFKAIEQEREAAINATKAVDNARSSSGAAQAKREAAEAKRQEKAQERIIRQAERYGERRRDILSTYAEESSAITKAQDQIDDLYRLADKNILVDGVAFIGKTAAEIEKIRETNPLGRGIYTQEMAQNDAAAIEQGVMRPLRDVYDQMEMNRDVQGLLLAGYNLEADALAETLRLYREIGTVPDDLLQRLVEEQEQQEAINDTLRSRNKIMEQYLGTADLFRDSLTDLIVDLPEKGLKAFGGFFKSILANYQRQVATRFTEKLFAGTDAKLRAQTRGTDGITQASDILEKVMQREAQRREEQSTKIGSVSERLEASLEDASDEVGDFASAVNEATARISNGGVAATPIAAGGAAPTTIAGLFKSMDVSLSESSRNSEDLLDAIKAMPDEETIVVSASRAASQAGNATAGLPPVSKAFSTATKDLLGGIDQIFGSNLTAGIGTELEGAFKGAGRGAIASGFADALGLKQSKTGAAIGGAIGGATGIPGADIVGALIGGTIGNALKKSKTGSTTLSFDDFGNLAVGKITGSSSKAKGQSSEIASTLIGRINQIAEALGGTVTGSGNISIGLRDDKIRVDTTGRGITKTKKGAIDFGDDLEGAIAFAVKTVIEQGVIGGISDASKRIIQSGQDLEIALEKALIIESIPKRLLQKTDPARYAITELNTEFEKMIRILKEAGATDAQFADAAKLYALERAEAIEEATQRAGSAIQDFIDNLKAGSDSPFSKRETFLNAQRDLLAFESDIEAGKVVDEDKLLNAARNFEDATSELDGRGAAYFDNLTFLLDLLAQAKTNATAGVATDGTPLPGNPFEGDQAVKDAIARANGEQVSAINAQTNVLSGGLQDIYNAILASGGLNLGYYGGGAGSLLYQIPNDIR